MGSIVCPICGWISPWTQPTLVETQGWGPRIPLEEVTRRTLHCEKLGCDHSWQASLITDEVVATVRRSRCARLDQVERTDPRPLDLDTHPGGAIRFERAAR